MPKIGLEIHGYLDSKEKLFCDCKAVHGLKIAKPNTNICPICTGMPGSKPMLPNSSAVAKALQIALILGCKINPALIFQRKHYDWPDLPKGYQNTISGSHASPIGTDGKFLGIGILGLKCPVYLKLLLNQDEGQLLLNNLCILKLDQ